MNKKIFGRKFSRNQAAKRAMRRSLIRELVLRGSIRTTLPKAKVIRMEIDKIMGQVRKGDVSARRRVLAALGNDKESTDRLFSQFRELTLKRRAGFTRITNLPPRRGDNAEQAKLEWTEVRKEKPTLRKALVKTETGVDKSRDKKIKK